jgi:primosomal protein N' (replication factor Y) (superfamily II helicase)
LKKLTTYADVAVPVGVRKTFAYSVPRAMAGRVGIGKRVLVPFGRKVVTGFVVGCSHEPPAGDFRIRPVREVLESEPAIPPELIALALWVADYYFTPPGEVLRVLVPAGSIATGERKLRLSAPASELIQGGLRPAGLRGKEPLILETLAHLGDLSLEQLCSQPRLHDAGDWVDALAERGLLQFVDSMPRARVGEKTQLGITAQESDPEGIQRLTNAQRDLYLKLRAQSGSVALRSAIRQGTSLSIARALEKKGLVKIRPMKIDRVPFELAESHARKIVIFTEAQRAAFERLRVLIQRSGSVQCLLHGVTGSGKTEIYLRLIADVLETGGTAMLLVPEIGLTPMLSRIAASHFPDRVALLHSGMSPGERFDQWHRIRSGGAQVVVGTRSAVFAPLEKLRLIVIDEEQDASYKQDEAPCYHAREVAWQRLQRHGGVLLMGSATPSIESYHFARDDSRILRFVLPERIEARPMPEITIVDMSLEFEHHGRKTVISEKLRWELEENIRRGEQSIVLLNRRGFSRSLLCRSCGNVVSCPDCSISMTFHQNENRLICHYCALEREVPSSCERCAGQYIYFVGVGTEQLEQIVRGILPKARLARVDRDTTRRRGALRKILFDFAARRLDVLVGTQMIAKGHDFPDVTLVGVVSADAGLAFPDFRSAERTFQLLTQVAGRAGRGAIPGRVVIQSFYPDHYALRYASKQDYSGFYQHEIEFRQLLGYPPYRKLVQILITDGDAGKGMHVGLKVAEEIKLSSLRQGAKSTVQVLGPAPAPLEKLRGQYRFQVLLKATPDANLGTILQDAFSHLGSRKVPLKNVQVDVDPLSLL